MDKVRLTHPKLKQTIHVSPLAVAHHEKAGWKRADAPAATPTPAPRAEKNTDGGAARPARDGSADK